MKINVKLFEENSVLKLERSMNDWTDKQNVEVIQIKYSSFGYRPTNGFEKLSFSSMIIYKDVLKNE